MSLDYNTFLEVLPKNQRKLVTPKLVDKINEMGEDPHLLGSFEDNLLSYGHILANGKYKIEDYVNAVRFVSYKLLGKNDIDCYAVVFPERYKKLRNEGVSRSDMSPYVSAYTKNKLVVQILEQTLVPAHIIKAPLHFEAINELMQIGLTGRSEVARVQALSKVADLTKAPETTKIELDIGMKENDVIADLRTATQELAKQQKLAIESGVQSTKEIAHSKIQADIIDTEVLDG
jgi:hypothetical protein